VEVDLRRLLGPAPEGPDRRGRIALDDAVDLAQKLSTFDEHFQPRIVGYYNENKIQIGKIKGEFVWHSHPDTDDFFLVLKGRLTIKLRDRDVELGEGGLFVVPRGVEHCPVADEEAHILLIEPRGTPNTGDSEAQPAPEREI
jgi:mannose-6-phosphate isomerase-like protein (cupin superfamily)